MVRSRNRVIALPRRAVLAGGTTPPAGEAAVSAEVVAFRSAARKSVAALARSGNAHRPAHQRAALALAAKVVALAAKPTLTADDLLKFSLLSGKFMGAFAGSGDFGGPASGAA